MIQVDSSVWIAYFRGQQPIVAAMHRHLDQDEVALSAPVRLDILSGARAVELALLRRVIGALPVFYPDRSTFALAESWAVQSRKRGRTFAAMDLLVGAIAAQQGMPIWSLDADFQQMQNMGFLKRLRSW